MIDDSIINENNEFKEYNEEEQNLKKVIFHIYYKSVDNTLFRHMERTQFFLIQQLFNIRTSKF